MTREIKFRFWDNGCMIYPNYWGCGNMGWFYGLPWEDDTYADIAMQYTGLKDKNGKEIYEGDLLKVKMYSGEYENYLIVFEIGAFKAVNREGDNYIISSHWGDCEIIGNLYENPELL